MDTFSQESLELLAGNKEVPCVSLFLPTHLPGKDSEQDAIRLKNLLREAELKLTKHGMDAFTAGKFLAQAQALPHDSNYWRKRAKGLAIFVSPNVLETFRTSLPLAETLYVSKRFHLRPLLPLLERDLSFYLLALSLNKVALYSVDEQSIEQLDVPNVPTNLAESLNYVSVDRGSQVHSAMHDAKGKQAAVFHGHGGQRDAAQADQLTFFAGVDKAITGWLGQSTKPMMLACVESLMPLYRKKNSYKHLMSESLTGNHDYDSAHDLHRRAWQLAEPLLTAETDAVAASYANRTGTQKVSDDPSTVFSAAIQGRVESLLYDPKAELFGEYNAVGQNVVITGNADDNDLIDIAAIETLRHGGTIHALTNQEIPTNAPMAAIFRY